jgi:hypothetical protein
MSLYLPRKKNMSLYLLEGIQYLIFHVHIQMTIPNHNTNSILIYIEEKAGGHSIK